MTMLNSQTELIKVQIQTGHSVQIFPNKKYEFLMTTQEVANGYDVTNDNIRQTKKSHLDELAEGYHYMRDESVSKTHGLHKDSILWTKAGVVRLGFFIKSGRAKIFRDWAEQLILDKLDPAKQIMDFAHNPQLSLNLQPTETVKVIPNELYETIIKIDSKATRMKLMKFYKQLAEKGGAI